MRNLEEMSLRSNKKSQGSCKPAGLEDDPRPYPKTPHNSLSRSKVKSLSERERRRVQSENMVVMQLELKLDGWQPTSRLNKSNSERSSGLESNKQIVQSDFIDLFRRTKLELEQAKRELEIRNEEMAQLFSLLQNKDYVCKEEDSD